VNFQVLRRTVATHVQGMGRREFRSPCAGTMGGLNFSGHFEREKRASGYYEVDVDLRTKVANAPR
jgi:hypothetical protein